MKHILETEGGDVVKLKINKLRVGAPASPAVVGLVSPDRYDEITGSCCVAWRDQIHQGSAKINADHIAPPQSSEACGGKKQSYVRGAMAPLGAIKYSSAIRH
ncbi:hypothetical protein F7725_007906 [Dissostichus mawsoni]|uniref:Uncharacterized protein n=1 Tax=Dissostichus mawsoni TaxID=36200 RepID=A0A7J5Y6K3_DISMA|nr:hypothetical protein F7725_007906 [Dissostichus mawsoni]